MVRERRRRRRRRRERKKTANEKKLMKGTVNVQVCTDAALKATQILMCEVIVQTEMHAKR